MASIKFSAVFCIVCISLTQSIPLKGAVSEERVKEDSSLRNEIGDDVGASVLSYKKIPITFEPRSIIRQRSDGEVVPLFVSIQPRMVLENEQSIDIPTVYISVLPDQLE
ncbi:Uncharacterised protein at_DN2601 [Pycnogonum litorale]